MRVFFSVYSRTEGLGGHFHSLVTIAKAMKEQSIELSIICIGKKNSPIIENSSLPYIFVNYEGERETKSKLKAIVNESNYDCIHCFDELAYYLFASISSKLLLTKCGGRNPKYYFPAAKYMSMFSIENMNYFEGFKKFASSKIFLIPNRVDRFETSASKVQDLRELCGISDNDFVILKISRIGKTYEKTIKQTISFFKALSPKFPNAKLIIVGAIYDKESYESINDLKGSNPDISIISDKKFIVNAKEVLDIADLYIGTGRSLMEASFKGKVLACHTSNNSFPVVVKPDNFNAFFERNFADRQTHSSTDEDRLEDVIKLSKNVEYRTELEQFSLSVCKEFFDVQIGVEKYIELYKEISLNKDNGLTFFDYLLFRMYFHRVLSTI